MGNTKAIAVLFECSSDNIGVHLKNIFNSEEPRKFTLRGQLKSAFSGSSIAMVPIIIPAGTTDILYSMRMATSEQDHLQESSLLSGCITM